MNAQPGQQPRPDESADHSDYGVASDAHSMVRYDLRDDPCGDEAD
jgi:DNA invertase Pin-like site-specific DNA recombinase